MKKFILTSLILSVVCLTAGAQQKRINLYAAYAFDDEVSSYYNYDSYFYGDIKGGVQYGAGLEFLPKQDFGVELLWIGQSTEASVHYQDYTFGGIERHDKIDLDLNYAMLGFNRYSMSGNGKIEGYGGLMLGALFASGSTADQPTYSGHSGSSTKFAWGLRLGVNIWGSERLGLKLQGQLLSAVQAVGGSMYFGTGGSGAGVSTYSSMLTCSLGGGLTFKLGK